MSSKFDKEKWEVGKKRSISREIQGRCAIKTDILNGTVNLETIEGLLEAFSPENPAFVYKTCNIPVTDSDGSTKMEPAFSLSVTLSQAQKNLLNNMGKCGSALKNLIFFNGAPEFDLAKNKDGDFTLTITPTKPHKKNRYAQVSIQMERYAKKMMFLDVVRKVAESGTHPMTYSVSDNPGMKHNNVNKDHPNFDDLKSFIALTQKTYVPNHFMGEFELKGSGATLMYSKGPIDELLSEHLTGLEKIEVAQCFEDGIKRAGGLYREDSKYYPNTNSVKKLIAHKSKKEAPESRDIKKTPKKEVEASPSTPAFKKVG